MARKLLSFTYVIRSTIIWRAFAVSLLFGAAHAQAIFETSEHLEAAVRTAALASFAALATTQRLQVGPIDDRLRLPACAKELQTRPGPGTRTRDRMLIEVSCTEPEWRSFVPARVVGMRTAVALARPAVAGQVLTAEDLTLIASDSAQLPLGFFADIGALVGKSVARSLGSGTVLSNQHLTVATAIARGQQVVLLASAGGMDVRMIGRAVTDGQVSQRIKVRNISSGRVVEGIARAPGVVEIISP